MTIASEDEIYKIMSMGVDKADRAIITLILSSGLSSTFIEKMTYGQLLDACDYCFEYGELKTIHNLVRKNPKDENIIPCFDVGKKSRPRMTCCSPESLQLIIEYLRYRKNIGSDDKKEYVFLNRENNPIANNDHISNMFRRARDKGNRYLLDESLKITSDDVRDRFKHLCKNHLQGRYRDEVLVLMGVNKQDSKADNKRFYEHVKENQNLLREHYCTVVNYLTLSHDCNIDGYRRNNYTINRL